MFLSWLRRPTQSKAGTTMRRPVRLRLENLEERVVLSGDVTGNPYMPVQVSDQASALLEAFELTYDAIWYGPPWMQAHGLQFGAGEDAVALQWQAGATVPAATAWSDILNARSLVNQELALYNAGGPNQRWDTPDTWGDDTKDYNMHLIAAQADQSNVAAGQILQELNNPPSQPGPPPAGSGGGTAPVLQGHVEIDVPTPGPTNWWQAAQQILSQAMDDLNQQLIAFSDSLKQWEQSLYDSSLQAALTFGQALDRRVDALGAYLTNNAAANEAAQFAAVGNWMTHNALDNQAQALQGLEKDFQHLVENPADAAAGLTFNVATGVALGGASGALDGVLFSGATGLEEAAAANALNDLSPQAGQLFSAGPGRGEVLASPDLIQKMAAKVTENGDVIIRRALIQADETMQAAQELQAARANAMLDATNTILLQQDARLIEAWEEYLHGTQKMLGMLDNVDPVSIAKAEIGVKEFMIRHQGMLGITDADAALLKEMMQPYIKTLEQYGIRYNPPASLGGL
jgi:hypothetical protein